MGTADEQGEMKHQGTLFLDQAEQYSFLYLRENELHIKEKLTLF